MKINRLNENNLNRVHRKSESMVNNVTKFLKYFWSKTCVE